ncbi:hypothetical protein DBV15_00179, partial [Temnothorax longispinosus]
RSSVRLPAPRERAVKNLLKGVGRRSGRPAGDDRKTDASFALEEELLARYEGAKVTADKPRAYVWKSYMNIFHRIYARGPPDSLIISLELVRIIYRSSSMYVISTLIYFRNFITILTI